MLNYNVKYLQPGRFYVLKNQLNGKQPVLWRLKNEKLHKFEHLDQNGRHLFCSVSEVI